MSGWVNIFNSWMDSCPLLHFNSHPFPSRRDFSLPQLSLQGWLSFFYLPFCMSYLLFAFLPLPTCPSLHSTPDLLTYLLHFKCLSGIPVSHWALGPQKSSKTSARLFPTQHSKFLPDIPTSSKSSCTTNPDSFKGPFRIQATVIEDSKTRMDRPHPPHPAVCSFPLDALATFLESFPLLWLSFQAACCDTGSSVSNLQLTNYCT